MVQRMLERSMVEGDLDGVLPYFNRDFSLHMPLFTQLPHGPRAFTAVVSFYRQGLTQLSVELTDCFDEDDRLVTRLAIEGDHTGLLGRLQPTGRRVRATGLAIWRFAGPTIAEAWFQLSLWDVLQQLGVVELVNSVAVVEA